MDVLFGLEAYSKKWHVLREGEDFDQQHDQIKKMLMRYSQKDKNIEISTVRYLT